MLTKSFYIYRQELKIYKFIFFSVSKKFSLRDKFSYIPTTPLSSARMEKGLTDISDCSSRVIELQKSIEKIMKEIPLFQCVGKRNMKPFNCRNL